MSPHSIVPSAAAQPMNAPALSEALLRPCTLGDVQDCGRGRAADDAHGQLIPFAAAEILMSQDFRDNAQHHNLVCHI